MGRKNQRPFFYSGFASQIGQFQYTRKINDTAKWGWGWGLPLLTLYAEKEWPIIDVKKINTSFMLGIWPVSINTKVFMPLEQNGYYFQGFSVNYYFHGGSYSRDTIALFSPYYPRSNAISLNYEGLYDMDSFNIIFSLGVNYLYMSYKFTSWNKLKFINKTDSESQWEKRPAWNASIGINF